jgi:hypothetical protein
MLHYTYKITDPQSGRYYVGRHSTENINDSYIGSGKWIRSLNDKKNLIKEILSYYDDFKSLCEAEKTLITEHYNNELNMNFNNSSVGFATGNLNPAHSDKEKQRRNNWNWMKTEDGKRYASINNPSKKDSVREKRKQKSNQQLDEGSHNFLKSNVRIKVIEAAKLRFKNNNPMKNPEILKKFQKPQERIECPHCGKIGGKSLIKRYHFDNCTKSTTAVAQKFNFYK